MNLYVVRHAIAVERGSPGYEDDSQRPLTDSGRKKMKKMVKGLRQSGIELDTILSSPYVRARDTARILAKEFKMEDQLRYSDNLIPPVHFEALIDEMGEKYDVENLALVGHEPMLGQFISWLTTGSTEMMINFKKGGVCYLFADNLFQDRRATLEWLLTPGLMVDLAK